MRPEPEQPSVNWITLLTPAVESWRFMVLVPLSISLLTISIVLSRPREWRAPMALSTIMTARNMPLAGGLTSLINGSNLGGLQPTPALIVRLSEQYGVLYSVAHASLPAGETVLDRLMELEGDIPEKQIVEVMSEIVHSSFDKQTGVITLEIITPDSSLSRFVAEKLVAEISSTFVRSSKTQATEIRQAMETRLDSARRALLRDEEALRRFLDQNRQVRPFTTAYIEQQRLQRAVDISQSTYTQAVADREDAVGKELEETPAVVVIDPLPRRLIPASRRTAIKAIVAFLTSLVFAWLIVLARAAVRAGALSEPEARRFVQALSTVPIIGFVVSRKFLDSLAGEREITGPDA